MQNTIEWNLDEEHKCFAWDATTLWQRRLVGSPPARAARWPARSNAGRKQRRKSAGHDLLAGRPEAISARPRNASWPARNDLPVGDNRRCHFFTTNADRVDLRRAPRLFRLGCDISSGDAFRLDSRPAEAERRPARSDGRRKQATPREKNHGPPAKRTRHWLSRKQHRRF